MTLDEVTLNMGITELGKATAGRFPFCSGHATERQWVLMGGTTMTKNIIILADGTGQRGGLLVDERRSNIYKIYRAVRCGPDSCVDATKQLAYYDPGLGTLPGGINSIAGLIRSYLNVASQATGLGILRNMEDCYAALIRLWRPGDQIFVFGFSRGAYTVRCLAGVLSLCGLPTRNSDGSALDYSAGSISKIAKEAVRGVYNYTPSRAHSEATKRQRELLEQRSVLAARFRERYGSDVDGASNCVPHFIGVFDTVASLMNPASMAAITAITLSVLTALAILASSLSPWGFLFWLGGSVTLLLSGVSLWLLLSKFRAARSLPGHPFWRTVHLNPVRVQMYDKGLDQRAKFARHALSIDETRHSFPRVKWGTPGFWKDSEPQWFEQLWFAGNHSDIGGSYPENESRLSDITLQWMISAAAEVGMHYDPAVLQTDADPAGMQHDETKCGIFRFARKRTRHVRSDGTLHASVLERFRSPGVLQFDRIHPYRPENLRDHDDTIEFYN